MLSLRPGKVPRHGLRGDVDDVGLNEGVVGDRAGQAGRPNKFT
jgi:hypothetical protein